MKLKLQAAVARRVAEEAERCYPREACGFLVGEPGSRHPTVVEALPAVNRAGRRDRYLIEAAEVWQAIKVAREGGRELLGVYHSHPDTDAAPSGTDLADAWGEWFYLIVPCPKGRAGRPACYRPRADRLEKVAIEVEDAGAS